MGLKPWEIITKRNLKWCPRARLTDHIKFLSVVFLIFLLRYGVYFMLKRKFTSTWRQKEDSQKFIVSKMTGQHFTGNILWPVMINMVGHVRWPDVISTPGSCFFSSENLLLLFLDVPFYFVCLLLFSRLPCFYKIVVGWAVHSIYSLVN